MHPPPSEGEGTVTGTHKTCRTSGLCKPLCSQLPALPITRSLRAAGSQESLTCLGQARVSCSSCIARFCSLFSFLRHSPWEPRKLHVPTQPGKLPFTGCSLSAQVAKPNRQHPQDLPLITFASKRAPLGWSQGFCPSPLLPEFKISSFPKSPLVLLVSLPFTFYILSHFGTTVTLQQRGPHAQIYKPAYFETQLFFHCWTI